MLSTGIAQKIWEKFMPTFFPISSRQPPLTQPTLQYTRTSALEFFLKLLEHANVLNISTTVTGSENRDLVASLLASQEAQTTTQTAGKPVAVSRQSWHPGGLSQPGSSPSSSCDACTSSSSISSEGFEALGKKTLEHLANAKFNLIG